MITHLATILEAFPGSTNRTRCFAHILNLVAKSIIQQFDTPKKKKTAQRQADDDVVAKHDAMARIRDTNDHKEADSEVEGDTSDADDSTTVKESSEPDRHEGMTAVVIRALEKSTEPVRLVLTRVGQLPKL